MIRSMFAGVAGLRTHQQKMDVIGNNIANVNTYGFKSARVIFKESIYQTISNSTAGNTVYGGSNPSQIGYGSKVGTVDLDFSASDYAPTGRATDCMIEGNGFFIVGPKKGEIAIDDETDYSQFNFTRVGDFFIDGDGYLVDSNRNVVYGFTATDGRASDGTSAETIDIDSGFIRPLRVQLQDGSYGEDGDDGDLKRMTLKEISIDSDGTIFGTNDNKTPGANPADGSRVVIGRLALANVPNPNALEKQSGPYFKAAANTGTIEAYQPGSGSTGTIMSSGLEMAKVDLAQEFSDMITTQRGFQANSKIITVSDEMLQELVNLKR